MGVFKIVMKRIVWSFFASINISLAILGVVSVSPDCIQHGFFDIELAIRSVIDPVSWFVSYGPDKLGNVFLGFFSVFATMFCVVFAMFGIVNIGIVLSRCYSKARGQTNFSSLTARRRRGKMTA